jgi:hypothetical protein
MGMVWVKFYLGFSLGVGGSFWIYKGSECLERFLFVHDGTVVIQM